tara:strand:- start:454 stop:666 length:213 start_codon:yes stop_codon:yes gene_type:complete
MSSPFQKQFSSKSPLNQTGNSYHPQLTGEEKEKAERIAKKNKGRVKEKIKPCPEGQERVNGFGGSTCVDK